MRKRFLRPYLAVILGGVLASCAAPAPKMPSIKDFRPIPSSPHGRHALKRNLDLAKKILSLDPNNITDADVRETLSKGPAPWILALAPLPPWSEEFVATARFFVDMGYPVDRIGDPRMNQYKIFWREKSEVIAGMAAWLYENDGMNPILVGWSGGGIMTVVVLHELHNTTGKSQVRVINARTGKAENRSWVKDPYTKRRRPISSLRFSFAASLAAGGLGRVVQDEVWAIVKGLHLIPDSVEEFVGFHSPEDTLGTDAVFTSPEELISANTFRPIGKAKVRSIIGDRSYEHFNVVHCEKLSDNSKGRNWVSTFRPNPGYKLHNFQNTNKYSWVSGKRNIWCGEVWYGIKKHWALQAQRVARFVLEESRLHKGTENETKSERK